MERSILRMTMVRVGFGMGLVLNVTLAAEAGAQGAEDPCRRPYRDRRWAPYCEGRTKTPPDTGASQDPCLDGRLTPIERAKCRGPVTDGLPGLPDMQPRAAIADPEWLTSLLLGRWTFDARLGNANLMATRVTGSLEFLADGTYAYQAMLGDTPILAQVGAYKVIGRGSRALPLLSLTPSRTNGGEPDAATLAASGLMGMSPKTFPITVTADAHTSGWGLYACESCVRYTNFMRAPSR